MRSSRPIPGSRWPHDMVLRIDDAPHALLELLWLREAWRLELDMPDAPPPLLVSPAPMDDAARAGADVAAWEHAWPEIWRATIDHAGTPHDHPDVARMPELSPEERAEVMRVLVGPTWGDRFGVDGLHAFHLWHSGIAAEAVERHRAGPGPEPELVDALVPAWRAGLLHVVTIPVRGELWQRIGSHGLLLADATRRDPVAYAAALRRFA